MEWDEIYFWIMAKNIYLDGDEELIYWNNVVLWLYTDKIADIYKKLQKIIPRPLWIGKIEIIPPSDIQPYTYEYFQFRDPWWNLWEVANYPRERR